MNINTNSLQNSVNMNKYNLLLTFFSTNRIFLNELYFFLVKNYISNSYFSIVQCKCKLYLGFK